MSRPNRPNFSRRDSGRQFDALSRVALTRDDRGGETVHKSKLLGTVVSSAISNTYDAPRGHLKGAADAASRAAISLGSDAAFNLFKEFWPDFARKVKLNVWIQNLVRHSIRDLTRGV